MLGHWLFSVADGIDRERCAQIDTGFVWLELPTGIGAPLEAGSIMVGMRRETAA
jgi:hypothetical protein